MKRIDGWQVHLSENPGRLSTSLTIYRESGVYGSNQIEVVKEIHGDGTLICESMDKYGSVPFFDVELGMLEALYEELRHRFQPRSGSHIEGKLEATLDHLHDLRLMIPQLNEKPL